VQRTDVALREVKLAGNSRTFSGYGAVFGNVDSHGDVIAPGAFLKSLAEHRASKTMPALLAQHGDWTGRGDGMMPVGVWTSMHEDEHGLKVEGCLSDTDRGREAYTLLKDRALTGLSIGYVTHDFKRPDQAGDTKRILTELELVEVSLVTFPSNPLARVDGVKLKPGHPVTPRIVEAILREAGVSRATASKIVALAKAAFVDQRDADGEAQELAAAIKAQAEAISRFIKRT